MKNAMLRMGYTCASMLIAGLTVTGARAEQHDLATVNLNEPVVVGSTTLPAGHYTITSEGFDVFLIHSEDDQHHALVLGTRVERESEAARTAVTLKNDGEGFRLDKLTFEGRTEAYNFN